MWDSCFQRDGDGNSWSKTGLRGSPWDAVFSANLEGHWMGRSGKLIARSTYRNNRAIQISLNIQTRRRVGFVIMECIFPNLCRRIRARHKGKYHTISYLEKMVLLAEYQNTSLYNWRWSTGEIESTNLSERKRKQQQSKVCLYILSTLLCKNNIAISPLYIYYIYKYIDIFILQYIPFLSLLVLYISTTTTYHQGDICNKTECQQ